MMIRRTRKPGIIATSVVCLLLSCVGIQGQPANEVGKINAKIVINFAAQQLSAELKYDYVAIEDHQESLVFYLNKTFDVKNVSCSLCQSFRFDTEAKPDPSLIIKLKKPLLKGQRLPINFNYGGSLKDIYKPDYKFLELGIDNFWFPIHPATVGFNFLYRLSIKTDEPGFDLVANGRSKRNDGGWLVESKVPDFDTILCSVKVFSSRRTHEAAMTSRSFPRTCRNKPPPLC